MYVETRRRKAGAETSAVDGYNYALLLKITAKALSWPIIIIVYVYLLSTSSARVSE